MSLAILQQGLGHFCMGYIPPQLCMPIIDGAAFLTESLRMHPKISEASGPKLCFSHREVSCKAKLTLDLVVRWEKPNVRQWDTSCVPIIKLYCDEITIFLQIQSSCALGEQKMGLGTNSRIPTPCQRSGDLGEDKARHHAVYNFPRVCRESTEGLLCNSVPGNNKPVHQA